MKLQLIIYIFFSIFFLAIGSFLNVVIYRLPLMLETKSTTRSINLFLPFSFCIHCNTAIKPYHNIPLLSFILLQGKCQSCKTRISWRYPLVELITTILSLFILLTFGLTVKCAFSLIFLWIIIPLIIIDYQYLILPNSLTLLLLWLGLIANTQHLFTTLSDAVLSTVGAYLSLWILIKLFYLFTGKIGMGNGDFKLFAAFGAWFGIKPLPFILLTSSLLGAIIGLLYLNLYSKDKNTPIPFGPFLGIAGLIVLLFL